MSITAMRKIVAACAAWVATAVAAPAIWNGSADISWYESSAQAYNLTTAEQLAGLAKLVNQGTSSFEGKTITLGADIFLNDTAGAEAGTWASVPHTEWTPIGTSSRPFKGEFDGIAGKKNRKIYGLYVSDATKDYVGLFGYTSNVKISNLDVLVGRITAKNNVGALVGYADSGSVTNVHSEIRVTGNNHVGGLVGYFTGTLSAGSAKENVAGRDSVGGLIGFTTGSISGTTKTKSNFIGNVTGRKYVGGIVGVGSSVSRSFAEGPVKGDSNYVGGVVGYTTGTVSSTYHIGGNVSGSNYVGGVVGYATGTVSSAYHMGGNVSGSSYVGGLAGEAMSSVMSSYSKGDVFGGGNCIGGLIGLSFYRYSGSANVNMSTLTGSYAVGNVTGSNRVGGLIGQDSVYRSANNTNNVNRYIKSSYSKGNVEGGSYVGGVVGLSNYGATSSTFNKNFYGYVISSYHIDGTVKGDDYVGGLAGNVYSSIDSSYHTGDDVNGRGFVGGLVGKTTSSVKNSYSEGNVTGTGNYVGGLVGEGVSVDSSNHAQGNVSGSSYVGGLIGRASSTAKNSYSEGNVTGTSNYVGGLVGYGTSIDSSNHVKGDVNGAIYVGGLVGKTTSFIKNSYSEGNVTGTGNYVGGLVGDGVSVDFSNHVQGDVSGSSYVGGLAGQTTSSVKNSYSEGDVTGTENYVGGLIGLSYYRYSGTSNDTVMTAQNSYAVGNVNGKGSVGGLVGLDSTYRYANNTMSLVKKISNARSVGKVTGNDNYVGGILGKSNYGYRSSSYSTNISLQIHSSYHKGFVESVSSYVGGVAGQVKGMVDSTYHIDGGVSGYGHVGGLIGVAYSTVKNSYSEGNVTGKSSYVGGLVGEGSSIDSSNHTKGDVSGYGNVGGLIGRASSTVKNSYSEGDVTGTSNYVGGLVGDGVSVDFSNHTVGNVSGYGNVGGLIGRASSTVKNSYSEGNVTGKSDYVGGLVGFGSLVYNSRFEGEVLGAKDYVGGIAGSASGKIRNSYVESKHVKGQNLVGGLAGYTGDSIDVSYFKGDSVIGVYQIGGLVGYAKSAVDSSYSTAHVKGDDNVGGLVGSAYGDVSNSYALGNVIGDIDHSSAGNDNLGGLVGYQYSGSVSKSMALGNVSGTSKLGGLVGRFDGTKISQSYANGDVTGGYYGDPADEVGNYYIGGLVGYAKGTLQETYTSGVVEGIEDDPVYTGCVVGYVNGSLSITKSYYDKAKCGLGIDGGEGIASVYGSPAKTTAEMQMRETFVDWDFSNTWKIKENTYPFLQIYSNSLTNAVVTTASLEGIVYDGTAKTPLVTSVTLFGESLEYETEYTITYKDNINAGTATINVCGVKPYGGCKIVEFEIEKVAIKPVIAAINSSTYTGWAQTPRIQVYNGGKMLAATNYIVEYGDNVNSGTATVSVTMIGNYSGSASRTFTIEKATTVVNQIPSASDVILGQTLAESKLIGGSANVDGEFVWVAPTAKPELENEGYAVVFVPTDTNYTKSADVIVPVKVLDLVYVAVHIGGNTLDSIMLVRGTNYTLPKVLDSTGYDFVGLYHGESIVGNAGDQIVVSENTVIDAVYKVKTFVITFKNGSTVLQSSEIAYGAIPIAPEVTLPENTAQYTYSFTGWDKEIVAVRETAIYAAVIDSVVNKYKIVFKNYDDTELKDSLYEYGTIATKIAKPANPMREASAQYSYVFKSWTPTISDVTEDAAYTAVFDSVVNAYMITFVNKYDTLQTVKKEMEYGSMPVYEGTPTRESTAQYIYTFREWSPEIVAVSEAVTYTAMFDSSVQSYVVTFVNDTEELQSDEIAYGVLPKYVESVPTKAATAQYTYNFVGWIPAIAEVTGPVTYKAIFDSTVNEYEIMFVNGSTILQSSGVAYGTMPTAPAVTLPKNTAQYTYSFRGWHKEIVPVTGNATYTAVIDSVVNEYEVVFKDYDGTVLKESALYDYGSAASDIAKPSNPTRGNTAQYSYAFKTWSPAITEVTENAVYTAEYDSTIRSYTITFANGNMVLQSSAFDYGEKPTYDGAVPTKPATDRCAYTFKEWSPSITTVSRDATYKAVFDSVVNSYTITFRNGSTILQNTDVAYGSTPTAPMVILPKNTAQYTYSFRGWDKEIVPVTGNATYTAVIDSVVNEYEVVFKDYDGIVLKGVALYDYGTAVSDIAKPSNPTRGNTAQYSYAFKTWSPAITEVTENAVYTAEYDSTIRSYTITFANGNEVLQSSTFDYGEKPTYDGAVPTKPATDQYSYTFKGWNPSITTVTRDTTCKAVFDSVVNSYTITFRNGSTILQNTDAAYGSTPTAPMVTLPKDTAQYTYSFRGWDKEIVPVTGNATYTAVIDSVVNEYEVVFKDYDGTVLKNAALYNYGTATSDIVKPSNPTRSNTAQYSYAFKTWSPAITKVTENAVYTAEYDSTIRSYTIVFKNGSSVLQSSGVAYGLMPTAPAVTLPGNTVQYTYSFRGWDKEIVPVTENVTYTAVIDSVVNKYEVSFKNYDGALIKTSTYEYGSTVAKPADPTRVTTAKFIYTFKGWTPTVASVTADAVYKAVFDSVARGYAIVFISGSDTLQLSNENYGTKPSYKGETPTKKATAQYAYTFKGWNPSITSVSGNATYKAVFDSTVKKYVVTFVNGDKKLQTISIAYGSMPKYTGVTPTKASTKNYSYEFTGWSPKIENVVGEATYQAVFDSTKLTGIMDNQFANLEMSVNVLSRNIQISAAPVGSTYAILDMQGRVLKNGRVGSANFNIAMPQAGIYLVRIGCKAQRVNVK